MAISIDQVRRIADLAKLELGEADLPRYAQQLSAILEFFEQLGPVETDGIDPDPGMPVGPSDLRADAPVPSLERQEALANAPDQGQGHFRVPRVLS